MPCCSSLLIVTLFLRKRQVGHLLEFRSDILIAYGNKVESKRCKWEAEIVDCPATILCICCCNRSRRYPPAEWRCRSHPRSLFIGRLVSGTSVPLWLIAYASVPVNRDHSTWSNPAIEVALGVGAAALVCVTYLRLYLGHWLTYLFRKQSAFPVYEYYVGENALVPLKFFKDSTIVISCALSTKYFVAHQGCLLTMKYFFDSISRQLCMGPCSHIPVLVDCGYPRMEHQECRILCEFRNPSLLLQSLTVDPALYTWLDDGNRLLWVVEMDNLKLDI